ncbi:MAG TPA: hypothetical protein VEA99_13065 [Gemmatimonadaceae bacterium]|nr:hypothetical protein [Gemmatimonadaceae bacterium]
MSQMLATMLGSMALTAVLFVIFGLLRPAEKPCTGDCGSCTGASPSCSTHGEMS